MTTGTAEATVERKGGGMPNWCVLGIGINHERRVVRYWPYTSEINGKRFLTRFIVVRTPLASVDITRVHMPDDQRAYPHDHSRTFWSWKFGWYAEEVFSDKGDLTARRSVRHRRFGIHRLQYTEAHSITVVSPRLVTVLFLGPRRQASNYWTPDGLRSIGMGVDQDVWE